MARLDNQQLMEEFYTRIQSEYPGVTFEQIKDICFGPWRFLKQEMESGELPTIKFMYFGKFQVNLGRAKNMLYNLSKKFENGQIEEDQYLKYKTMIEKFLQRHEEAV